MSFYNTQNHAEGPLDPRASQQTTADGVPYLEFMRTNNLNKVSENFLNTLVNDQPANSQPTGPTASTFNQTAAATRSQDSNMDQLRALMEKSHQNPTRNRKSVPKRDRKDWDIAKMAIKSTGSNFEAQLNEHIFRAAKDRRPLNEIIKGGEQSSHQRTASVLNEKVLQGLDGAGDWKGPAAVASRRSSVPSQNLSVVGKQKDVKENAYSERSAQIKYASVEPISLKDSKEEADGQSRMGTIFKQLNLIHQVIDKRGGKLQMDDKASGDADAKSQVSAITFIYSSSSMKSKKKAKDGIQQMNEETSARLRKNRLAKLQDDQDKKKKDVTFQE